MLLLSNLKSNMVLLLLFDANIRNVIGEDRMKFFAVKP